MVRVSGPTSIASTRMRRCLDSRLGCLRRGSFSCCNSLWRSSTSCVSEETTAMCVSEFALEPRKMLPKMNPAMMTGIITVVMTNPRVRMRSMYSRRAISQTLCIEVAPRRFADFVHGRFAINLHRRALADFLDKDVFERGFRHLEARDARASDILGEGCRGTQLDLDVAAVALEAFDTGVLEEGVIALEVDLDAIARVSGFDLAHRA